jgi:hypothetical protein
MEQYLWMAIGSIGLGFFVKTYWDVYMAYRAYMNTTVLPAQGELVGAQKAAAPTVSVARWLLDRGDRFLHAMLMSPISR